MLLGRMRATCGRLGSRGLATAMPEMLAKPAAQYVNIGSGLEVDLELKRVVDDVIMPGTGVEPAAFWRGFGELVLEFGPRNRAALEERDRMQHALDHWHLSRRALGLPHDPVAYRALLIEIGYLIAPPAGAEPVKIRTANVDAELASVAGPQLVCPVDNARFIVNAANARWGSLLDALYGTDVVPGAKPTDGSYSAARGQAVFDEAHRILNKTFPLDGGAQWGGVQCLTVDAEGDLHASLRSGCNAPVGLMSEEQFVGFRGERSAPTSILLRNHGLHVELVIDRSSAIGATHKAGLADIQVEAALTAICDAEDSASAVDASDKARAYLNWHGLMARTLAVPLRKGGAMIERTMNPPRSWTSVEAGKAGSQIELPGSAVLLCRNVGLHMHTDVVRATDGGAPTPEHFLDAAVSILAAVHDFRGPSARRNSRAGSVYIVKPKMHAPREVALCADLFGRLEALVGLPALSVKMGMMDEERRATANLPEMMRAAQDRLVFINTGFLDRTGDEIHSVMEAGPVVCKAEFKQAKWLVAYESANVATALQAGLLGRGQIGKGMWAAPDAMADMMRDKLAHLQAGASCAWVPSPTAAVLHALHYHALCVRSIQDGMLLRRGGTTADVVDALLTLPLLERRLSAEEVAAELENNAQGILGYVSRWVGQGIGCSKVQDVHGVALMEDRATLRISSQHMANWLLHGVVSEAELVATMRRMAVLVDAQNAHDPEYKPMSPAYSGPEWKAALELVFGGRKAPNGYTEPALTKWRLARKALEASK